jgi:hypothetical protein
LFLINYNSYGYIPIIDGQVLVTFAPETKVNRVPEVESSKETVMGKIFVRERRHAGKGAGRPRFAVVAVEGADLKIYAPHVRKAELDALAAAVTAEVVILPRGEKAAAEETAEEQPRGRRRGWGRGHDQGRA